MSFGKRDSKKEKMDIEPDEDSRVMRFIYGILHHRRVVIVCFAIFTLLCALCIPLVNVNYNLSSYLPQETNSTQAIDLMDEAYGTDIPNARMYALGISLTEAAKLADDLREIDGVDEVLWLGDQVDIIQPLEVSDPEVVSSWMSDVGFLYQLTIDGDKAAIALDEARETGYANAATDVALSGDAVSTVSAQESTASEILYIMLMAVVIIIVIISLTSHSWFEWVVFLLVLAMAIMMNMGTNIIKGEISFITQICAAVLQLAVSMDYAIVMLHTFRRYHKEYPDDPVRAMAHAVHKGFSVVFSSAAVTFFGFLSLSVMSFLIGVDMGVVLAKGIFFSFLAVMFLMPCIILACLKPLNRFEHKPLLPSFDRFGSWCTKLMIPLSIIIVIVAVPSFLGQSRTDFSYGAEGMTEADSPAGKEAQLIEDTFEASETWVMMVPEGEWANEKALVADLEALPKVSNVVSYLTVVSEQVPTEMASESQISQLIAGGYTRIVIQTTLDSSAGADFDMVETVRGLGEHYYGDQAYLAGTQVSEYDLKITTGEDSGRVKLFSIGAIAIVLMLMFRSLSIPLIVLLPIEISIWINLAIPYFTGQSINYIGYLVIDAVQLGAAVDYAIIYTREYLEQRGKYKPLKAARTAISHSAITIMTSALILTIAGLAIFFVASNTIISEIGMLIGRGAFISMLMMFTLLPLLFVLCDWIIRHTTIGLHFYSEKAPKNTTKSGRVELTTAQAIPHNFFNKPERSAFREKRMRSRETIMTNQKTTEQTTFRMRNAGLAVLCSLSLIVGSMPVVSQNAYAASENEATASVDAGEKDATPGNESASDGQKITSTTTKSDRTAATDQAKEEVVYAKLQGNGSVQGIYVVNGFHFDKETTLSDPGIYESVTNLTTTDILENKNSATKITAPQGDFYYKGELAANTELPWNVALSYTLDGKSVEADDLAGASGELEIGLSITPAETDSLYVDNYLLQASGSFSSDAVSDLEAEGGSVAAAGADHQVTFMVLPGGEGDFTITADVRDFTFDGFTIAAVPLSLALDVDSFETAELTGSMDDLKDAVSQLNEGAGSLEEGSTAVAEGLSTLTAQNMNLSGGSSQVSGGITQLDSSTTALAQGSSSFVAGIDSQKAEVDTKAAEMAALASGKQESYVAAMTGAQDGLGSAQTNLEAAYGALASGDTAALQAALGALAGDLETVGGAVSDAAGAIGTEENAGWVAYQAQAAAYAAVGETCSGLGSAYSQIDSGVQALSQATPGLALSYATFDEGLNAYLSGVSTLNSSYGTFQQGISTYREGMSEFETRTSTIDQDLIDGVKDELKDYLNADYELHSFVDPTNTEVSKVQFIYMSDPIEKKDTDTEEIEEDTPEDTPWTRLLALFE